MNVTGITSWLNPQPEAPKAERKVETAGSLALGGTETAGAIANTTGGSFCALA